MPEEWHRGHSMVELLVAMLIMTILMAMAWASYSWILPWFRKILQP